jgi:GT2 family glycosyltransferase
VPDDRPGGAGLASLSILMDARAPAVVAVVVTRDPGPWLESTLASLRDQDYPELSVLVVVTGGADLTTRVADVCPDAFVRPVAAKGFGAAANQVLEVVQGASFFLLCHDDCSLDPDALRTLVQESFRSNAGIVSPKMVRWDDPEVLLHVGMNVDKTGAVADRVQPGEIDHGQHDAVRDVFVAPGGCTLIRADLFEELGGYDSAMSAMAEDLDLCWRAQMAGARVVVAPDARVRHLEVLATGLRDADQLAPRPGGPATPGAGRASEGSGPEVTPSEMPPALRVLERRHELRTVLKAYSAFHLLRVLPQAFVLALAEVVVAIAQRDPERARSVLGAWTWNLRHLGDLRAARRTTQRHRHLPDSEVRRLQVRGSIRLSAFVSQVAHSRPDPDAPGSGPAWSAAERLVHPSGKGPTLAVGTAFSEDADFDELDDLGRRARAARTGLLNTRRGRLAAALVVILLLVIGTRGLLAAHLPLVGQFLPMLSWTGTWHRFFAVWQPAGVGGAAPASPGFALLGLVGTVTLGAMGLAQKVVVLGAIPVGAWGVSRLLRPIGSPRARFIGAICYLGLPLPYDAFAHGRWDGLVAYAATPWVLRLVAYAAALPPFVSTDGGGPSSWRRRFYGRVLSLAVVESVAVAFAPAMAVVVLLVGLGIVAGSVLVGDMARAVRGLAAAAAATVGTALLCLPWVVGTLAGGTSAANVFGAAGAGPVLTWEQVLRFDVGPTGGSFLSWLLVAAALLPLLVGRGERLAWAGRLWTVACLAWVLAWAVARRWTGAFDPTVEVLLAPAATAVAASIGIGVAAFETDLSGYRFGWRQMVTTLMGAVALVGLVPVLAEVGNGRWGLAPTGYEGPLSYLASASRQSSYRVLWLGNPAAIPLGSWSIEPGFAYATSEQGLPDARYLWAPASPGPAAGVASAVQLARDGQTVVLGQLLAPAAIRYVVVMNSVAPNIPGLQTPESLPAPQGLLDALYEQEDLREIPGGQGFTVFENTDFLPQRAQHPGLPLAAARPARSARTAGSPSPAVSIAPTAPTPSSLAGWRPALAGAPGGLRFAGPVSSGTVFASYAPAGSWHLVDNGRDVVGQPAFAWAAQYQHVVAGKATLRFEGSPLDPLGAGLEVGLWVLVVGTLLGRSVVLGWLQPAPPDLRRRRRRRRRTRRSGRGDRRRGDRGQDHRGQDDRGRGDHGQGRSEP